MDYTEDQLQAALDEHEQWIAGQTGVATTGVGIGRRHPLCIKVYGDAIDEATQSRIERHLGSLPVEFESQPRGMAY